MSNKSAVCLLQVLQAHTTTTRHTHTHTHAPAGIPSLAFWCLTEDVVCSHLRGICAISHLLLG